MPLPFAVPAWIGLKSIKMWLVIGGIAILGFLIWQAVDRVKDHFSEFERRQTQIDELKVDNTKLQERIGTLAETNRQNSIVYQREREQRLAAEQIAEEERKRSSQRQVVYREIRDEIAATPQSERRTVDPVVARTIDRLWR